MDGIDIDNWFTHHPPRSDSQVHAYQQIREGGKILANRIRGQVPDGPEKQKAVEAVREAVMWANAGIACS